MKRVMVFGTFDPLHPGHRRFFKQAKEAAEYLIVVVARDKYVQQAKGKAPLNGERQRVDKVRSVDLVDKAILGSRTHNFYRTIRTYRPDIIALGYDQNPAIKSLRKDLQKHRLKGIGVIRLKPYKPRIYKSSRLKTLASRARLPKPVTGGQTRL